MGASLSSNEPNKLAVAAVAHIMHLDGPSIVHLKEEFEKVAENCNITNAQFNECLVEIKVHPADKEILDRLFVLNDRAGDGIIDYKEFLIGLAVVTKGNAKEKLRLAFQIYDTDKLGNIPKDSMKNILQIMGKTSSFFGDRPPTEEAIVRLLENMYDEMDPDQTADISYNVYLKPLTEDVLMEDFVKQSETSVKLQKDTIDD